MLLEGSQVTRLPLSMLVSLAGKPRGVGTKGQHLQIQMQWRGWYWILAQAKSSLTSLRVKAHTGI